MAGTDLTAQACGIVYLARNTMNGKGYVGRTIRELKHRTRNHRSEAKRGSRTAFHCAIRKYGFASFAWQILTICQTRGDLNTAERLYITMLRTKVPNGYNRTDGGLGASGCDANKGKVRSAETKRKMGEILRVARTFIRKRPPRSAETKQKISESLKTSPQAVEHRRIIHEAQKGKPHSMATKRKMSEAHKRRREIERGA